MKHSSTRIVRIEEHQEQATLSAAQKSFNRLIKKIDKQRAQLAAWQATMEQYQQKHASEFAPLEQTFDRLRGNLVELLDSVYLDNAMTKTDRARIKHIICSISAEILFENDNEKLKSLYNKYSDTDFDAEIAEGKEAIKSMMEGMFDVEIDEHIDVTSPEQMLHHLAEKMRERAEQEADPAQQIESNHSQRKKSAKESAREAKQQAEAQQVSQSIREVFRKLASALHPDREQDPTERDRKTALMQRVNVAYQNKDLLKLLELQLEVEQIDQSMINSISDDRLKHYNKVLTEQSSDLQTELKMAEEFFRARFEFPPFEPMSPSMAMGYLQGDIQDIRFNITELEKELISFQNMKNLKRWLKTWRVERQPRYDENIFEELDAMFSHFA